MIVGYELVVGTSDSQVSQRVDELLLAGWEPFGPCQVVAYFDAEIQGGVMKFCQTMLLHEDTDEDDDDDDDDMGDDGE